MPHPTSTTLTFLFTDIEGSTARWEQQREAMSAALLRHDAILRAAIEGSGGTVFKTVGDAFCSRVERIFPSEALVQLDGRPCKAMADQLTTASKTRLLRRAGALRFGDLEAVERAVQLQLGLS